MVKLIRKTEAEGVTKPAWDGHTKSKGVPAPSLDDQAAGPKYKTRTKSLESGLTGIRCDFTGQKILIGGIRKHVRM